MSTPINPAVEYVRNLPIEDQEAILADMLQKLIDIESPSQFFKVASVDHVFGYFLTPEGAKAQFEAFGPKFTPEYRAELDERLKHLDRAIPAQVVIEELRKEAAELARKRRLSTDEVGETSQTAGR
jgi:hypothetical protein